MKPLWIITAIIAVALVLLVAFCGRGRPPSTTPLADVEAAILAANAGDYPKASDLLDISPLASAAKRKVDAHWDWITSKRRVTTVVARPEEMRGEARRIFVTLTNANYPTHTTGFWIRWNGRRWVATEQP